MPTYVARLEVLVEADSYDEAVKLSETCVERLDADIAWRWNDGRIRNAAMTHLSVQYKRREEGALGSRTTTIHAADGTPLARVNHARRPEWPADVNEGCGFDWDRAQRVVLPKLRRSDFDEG